MNPPAPAAAPAATVPKTPPPAKRQDTVRIQVATALLSAQIQARGPNPLNQVQDGARRIMARTALDFADVLIELDAQDPA